MSEQDTIIKKMYMKTLDDFWERLEIGYEDRIRYSLIEKELNFYKNKPYFYLDIGCGTGVLCIYAGLHGAKVIGLDISNINLVKAKNMVKNQNIQNCSFIEGDICNLPLRENTFDRIVCTEVLEHLINPNEALKEIKRVSKIGTEIIITVPNLLYPWRWIGRIGLSIIERIKLFQYGIANGFINEHYKIKGHKLSSYHLVFNPFFFKRYISHYFNIKKLSSTLKWRVEFLPHIPMLIQKPLIYYTINNKLLIYFGLQIICVAIVNDTR